MIALVVLLFWLLAIICFAFIVFAIEGFRYIEKRFDSVFAEIAYILLSALIFLELLFNGLVFLFQI